MRRRSSLQWLAATILVAAPVGVVWARERPIYLGRFSSVAVGGYDPVAYFTEGKPVKGEKKFEITHEGVKWHFVSAAHRDKFVADPQRYAPQYGGYCAWLVAEGNTAAGDPQFWKIVDGKLYLNNNAQVQATWQTDIPGFIRKADKNWPAVLGK